MEQSKANRNLKTYIRLAEGLMELNSYKPSPPLLVHLSPRCNSINSHKEQLLRLDDLEQYAQIVEYILEYFLFCDTEVSIGVIGM